MNRRIHIYVVAAAVLAVLAGAGFLLARALTDQAPANTAAQAADQWVCPMHPDVRQDHPGRCPICGMALEKTSTPQQQTAHGEAHGARAAAASPSRPSVEPPPTQGEPEPRAPVTIEGRRQQLIGVRTVVVSEETLTQRLRATGIVRFDESRWTDINVRAEGWIRELYVERTGDIVRRGQPLLAIYSPELATAQAEYVLALKTRDALAAGPATTEQADRLVTAARQRLGRWDVPEDHLAGLGERREVPPLVTFRSPVSGIVMEKRAVEGMRVMPGDSLYRIVDASTVWVEADVYEVDLSAVRVGQRAEVTFDAWPGQAVSGRVTWIAPTLDETARTAKVRLELPNRAGRLKPGMFAHASLVATIPRGPVIPADALLDTGGQQFVFVTDGDGHFEPRRIRTGHRVDGQVQVLEGVASGELVAASATFFIDSESQLRAALEGYKGTPTQAAPSGAGTTEPAIQVALTSVPDPPRAGMTQFQVAVTTKDGQPITDAAVTLVLYMPPMPSMNMPAMRSEAALGHAGSGVYRGSLDVMMNGRWEATVTVTRGAERLGARQLTLIAR
jgi:multidrug efflux pump subunit AcrA (membrane-fusion protein)